MNNDVVRPKAIVVCGLFGSGKTTVAKRLSALLGIPHVSTGAIFRAIAQEKFGHLEEAKRVIEMGLYYEAHPELDLELDDRVLAEVGNGRCVADGRVTAALAKRRGIEALKVQLLVDPLIGAQRVAGREGKPVDQAIFENQRRETDIARRLMALYSVDANDAGHYDLIVGTDDKPVESIVGLILDAARPLGYAP